MIPMSKFKALIPFIQKLTALSAVGLALSGCEFGNNKQFFENSGSGTSTATLPTGTPTLAATPDPSATPTPTPSATPTASITPTPAPSATPSSSVTPTPTPVYGGATPTPTPVVVSTPTPAPTATPRPTATPTPSPTATPAPTATPSPTATPTPSPTATPFPTATPTPSPTATPRPTSTPTPTPAPTATPTPTSTPSSGTPPVAVNDGPFEIAVNQTLTIQTSALLANDYDPHGLPIHYSSFQAASGGTLTLNGGTFTFVPANNFVGTVTFVYTIANSLNLTASATVTIDVRTAATEVMYGQSPSTLYSYDPSSHASTVIANFRLANGSAVSVRDIAITTNGLMYAVDGANLYYVNAATGVLTKLPTQGISTFGNINGLTALSDGDLVISGDGIVIYNIASQTLTTLLAPGGYQSSGDIIALPDGNLYMAASTNGNDHLIRINPTTGATFDLGSLGHEAVYGLGYADGVFYGFASNGQVFNITTTSTSVSTSGNVNTGIEWYGATTNPVLW